MLYPFLAVYFTEELGFSSWVVGLILGVRVMSQQGLTVVGGTLADRLGYKPMIIVGLALRAIGFAMFGLVGSVTGIVVASMLTGLAGAMFSPALRAYIATESTGRRAEIFALDNIFSQVGTLAGPLVGVVLLSVSFTFMSLVAGGIFFALMILQMRYLPRQRVAESRARRSVWREWREVMANRAFVWFALAMFGYYTLYNQLYLGLPLEVQRVTGSDQLVSVLFIVSSLVTIFGQVPIIAYCRARLGPFQTISLGLLLMSAAFLPLLLLSPFLSGTGDPAGLLSRIGMTALTLSPVLLAALLLTVGIMMTNPFAMEMIPQLARERLVGTHFGFYGLASGIGATLGNTLTGALFDAQGSADTLILPWIIMLSLGLVSGGLIWLLERRGRLTVTPLSREQMPT